MSNPPLDVSRVFALEAHGPDTFVGESPNYPWGRIYGGLVIAQGLWAATQSVADEHHVHSLHAYFILGGNPAEPVRYEVDRVRNGRSFSTRRVLARQSGGVILSLEASYQRHEGGPETQSAQVPAGLREAGTGKVYVEGSGTVRDDIETPTEPHRMVAWCRYPNVLGDDLRLQACALAYISDATPIDAAIAAHPVRPASPTEWKDTFMSASLDHAMWFHRPVPVDEWLLFDLVGHGITGNRGLATGQVFSTSGQHIATFAQEGLIRLQDRRSTPPSDRTDRQTSGQG